MGHASGPVTPKWERPSKLPPRRITDSGGRLSAAEALTLQAMTRGLADDDRRLAGVLGRFGARGRVSRVASTLVFLLLTTAVLGAAAVLVTPMLAMVFAVPVYFVIGALVVRVFAGPGRR